MADGGIVYDGSPNDLSDEQLRAVYGGEGWLS